LWLPACEGGKDVPITLKIEARYRLKKRAVWPKRDKKRQVPGKEGKLRKEGAAGAGKDQGCSRLALETQW